MYTAATDSKRFRESCGIDYGDGEAESVGTVQTTSMDACMDAVCDTREQIVSPLRVSFESRGFFDPGVHRVYNYSWAMSCYSRFSLFSENY